MLALTKLLCLKFFKKKLRIKEEVKMFSIISGWIFIMETNSFKTPYLNKLFQENLTKFREEREKLEQSEALKKARQKFVSIYKWMW